MAFYALFITSIFLVAFAIIINPNNNFPSILIFKIIPAILGLWCLWTSLTLII